MEIMKFLEMLSVDQGWINVKIDSHLKDRIFKYVEELDRNITDKSLKFDLKYKLQKLISFKDSLNMKDMITFMIILQYFKEIKDNFDGPAGGLLMEEILSCLVYGDRVPGNKKEDFIAKNSKRFITRQEGDDVQNKTVSYQVKFYTRGNYIKIDMSKLCDITVVCIRDGRNAASKIHICFLTVADIVTYSTTSGISTAQLVTNNNASKVVLDFFEIDKTLEKIGSKIKDSIIVIYDNLAELHDVVDDIMLGDKNKVKKAEAITDVIKSNINNIIE